MVRESWAQFFPSLRLTRSIPYDVSAYPGAWLGRRHRNTRPGHLPLQSPEIPKIGEAAALQNELSPDHRALAAFPEPEGDTWVPFFCCIRFATHLICVN